MNLAGHSALSVNSALQLTMCISRLLAEIQKNGHRQLTPRFNVYSWHFARLCDQSDLPYADPAVVYWHPLTKEHLKVIVWVVHESLE